MSLFIDSSIYVNYTYEYLETWNIFKNRIETFKPRPFVPITGVAKYEMLAQVSIDELCDETVTNEFTNNVMLNKPNTNI